MNTISSDFKFFIDNDLNPFVLFSNTGNILYLNKSAELIMGIDTQKKLFDLAITHAPQSFGHRVTLQEILLSPHEFYGMNVLYTNDDEIAIQLYTRPRPKTEYNTDFEGYVSTDINLLLQANIELFKTDFKGDISLMTDYTMPKVQLHQNSFSILLREVLLQFSKSSNINITLTIKIGSKVIINECSYTIYTLKLIADKRVRGSDEDIEKMALSNYIDAHFDDKSIILEIPAIT